MTLQEIADYHAEKAFYFERFGEDNLVTAFHRQAADCARSAVLIIDSIPIHAARFVASESSAISPPNATKQTP